MARQVAWVLSLLFLSGCPRREPAGSDARDASGDAHARGGPTTSGFGTPPSPARGKELYERYCDFCHGSDGKGYAADEAPALANEVFLATASDAYIRDAINKGRPGTTMSAWSLARGGPIQDADANAIVQYIRTWQKGPAITLPEKVAGDATRGAPLYAKHCASCHGKEGYGAKYIKLADAELLAAASDGFLATTIARGRPGTPMPEFASKLDAGAIGDIVALLRSWQQPAEQHVELPPRPGGLHDVVIHPKGPEPTFDPKADFVPVDDVKRELDRGATMIIADARAGGDYARMHVAGAISVPFYEVEPFTPQIPKDRFIITYCGCPHAESGKLRDTLRKLGYTRVAVLNEGINTWRDRGYPVRGGPKP